MTTITKFTGHKVTTTKGTSYRFGTDDGGFVFVPEHAVKALATTELVVKSVQDFVQDVCTLQFEGRSPWVSKPISHGAWSRKDTDYTEIAFDRHVHHFLAGALLNITEVLTTPSGPRAGAYLGLIPFLTSPPSVIKSAKRQYDEAFTYVSTLYAMTAEPPPPGKTSRAHDLVKLGKEHWNKPNALKNYFDKFPAPAGVRQSELDNAPLRRLWRKLIS
jgi:hypothetical protein